MDAVLDRETGSEQIIFDCYSNEYADELRFEINNQESNFRARIEPEEPRRVIRERLL